MFRMTQNIMVSRQQKSEPLRARYPLPMKTPAPRPLRAALYARVRCEDALDLAKQGHALRAFAEQKGWEVVLTEHEVATVNAIRLNARERLLKAVRSGGLDVIVAWKLDRIAHSLPELVSLLELLKVHNVALATLADDFDFTSDRGPELFRIIRVLSAFQRMTHRDQVKSGLARATSPVGRPSTAIEHRPEILALMKQGHSQREIARRLGLHPRTVARLLKSEDA
jgi:DNA invertase Pin-like site-specific DNA recombinase